MDRRTSKFNGSLGRQKMTKYVYVVFEDIDEDGGFGDAVRTKEAVTAFLSKESAEKYVKENDNKHVHEHPYDDLYCGGLHIEKVEVNE